MSYIEIEDLSKDYDHLLGATYSISIHSKEISLEDAHTLAGILQGRHVTNLRLSHTHLSSESLAVIAKALASVNHYISIYLNENQIDDVGAKSLAEALRNKKIGILSLSGNDIGDEGAEALAVANTINQTATLVLTKNKIGPSGAEALVKAWTKSYHYSVDLSDNLIGDEGAERIGKVLETDPGKVESLYLKNNGIGLLGDEALAKTLPAQIKNITYRTREVDFKEYSELHPNIAGFMLLFIPFSWVTLPFMKFDVDVEGLITPRKSHTFSKLAG